MSTAFSGWMIDAWIASAVLMGVVLLIRGPVRRMFGPQLGYALWALPLLRLVLPPMPAGWHALATPVSRASETITVFVVEPTVAAAPSATTLAPSLLPSLGLLAAILWGAGAAAFLLWHFAQHTRFCRRMIGTGERLDAHGGIQVIETDAAPGPIAFGIVRRYVAFPRDFAAHYDADERELALAHELGHHARGDLVANWIALVVLALHWFNPLAWRAFRAFRADQELANDARVLAGRSAVDRHIYACAIVKAAHGGALSAACHLHTIADLKGRLTMLTTSRASRRRLAAGAASVTALVAGGLAATASGTPAAARIAQVATLAQAAVPAIPAVPAPVSAASASPMAATMPPAPPVPPVAGAAPSEPRIALTDNGEDHRPVRLDPSRVAIARIPRITHRNCADGRDGYATSYVLHGDDQGRPVVVICANRIAAAAARASVLAAHSADIKRRALASARDGLVRARATIIQNDHLSATARRETLAGLDTAMAEIDANAAGADRD